MVELCTNRINKCKIGNWKDRSKREMTWRSSLRRQSSVLNCGAIGEEDREDEEILNSMYLK
jgi:hypothetical protein